MRGARSFADGPKKGSRRLFVCAGWLAAMACGAALILAAWRMRPAPTAPLRVSRVPVLQLPRFPLSLGSGEPDQELTGSFKIRNDGGAPLEFNLKPGCGCTSCSPVEGTIAPDETAEIDVAIKLESNSGTSRRVDIGVMTNDPDRRAAVYHVTADCPAPFSVEPPMVQFGSLPLAAGGKARRRVLTVRALPTTPLGRLRHEDLVVEHEAPWLTVEPEQSDGEPIRLAVTLRDDVTHGYFSGTVRISLADRPRQFVSVTVEGEIVGDVEVSPSSLFLKVDPASGEIPGKAFVVFRPDKQPLGAVTAIEAPEGIRVAEADGERDASHRRLFRVSGRLDQRGASDGDVRLGFERLGGPVVLRLHFARSVADAADDVASGP